jgi:hypothetical protein
MTTANPWVAPEVTQAAFTAMVQALRSHPAYKRACEMSRDLRAVEEIVETALRTKYSDYMEIAKRDIDKFKEKWLQS